MGRRNHRGGPVPPGALRGPTIDLGCGPGRLTAELARRGVRTLGVDLSGEAVEAAAARCAPVLRADLFGPLPGEVTGAQRCWLTGTWESAAHPRPAPSGARPVTPGGRVVLDCASPGTGVRLRVVHLRAGGLTSEPFPWAEVGVDALGSLATDAGLVLAGPAAGGAGGSPHCTAPRSRRKLMALLSGTRLTDRIDRLLPREEAFRSALRGADVASRVGLWLGLCFLVALLTGVYSHFAQQASTAIPLPGRPVSLYRVTQTLHIAAGTAAVPLLLVKMWAVYPKLFARPPRQRRAVVLHVLERLSIAALVASAIFQLATGLANAAQWYPWAFGFRETHYAVGWVAVGALLVHVAVKLPIIRDALAQRQPPAQPGGVTRRSLLRATWLAAGVAVLATAAAGVPGVRRISVLAVRSGEGPGGVPINRSAAAAGVSALATDPGFALSVVAPGREVRLSQADLEALPQTSAELPSPASRDGVPRASGLGCG